MAHNQPLAIRHGLGRGCFTACVSLMLRHVMPALQRSRTKLGALCTGQVSAVEERRPRQKRGAAWIVLHGQWLAHRGHGICGWKSHAMRPPCADGRNPSQARAGTPPYTEESSPRFRENGKRNIILIDSTSVFRGEPPSARLSAHVVDPPDVWDHCRSTETTNENTD